MENLKIIALVVFCVFGMIVFPIYQTHTDKEFISENTGVHTDSIERIFFTFTNSRNGWTRTYEVKGKTYLVNGIFNLDLYD